MDDATSRVVVIGAGGHGQVVADILQRMADAGAPVTPIGFLDDNLALAGKTILGLPVLGRVADLAGIEHDAVIVALGHNRTRLTLARRLESAGERFVIARHPAAVIAPSVEMVPGTVVCAGVVVNPGSRIGAHVILNTGSTVDHHNRIGDGVHIAPGVHLGGDVTIGEGSLVGIGATVMSQRSVGAWAVVAAGALVSKNVPDAVTVAGSPARISGRPPTTPDAQEPV